MCGGAVHRTRGGRRQHHQAAVPWPGRTINTGGAPAGLCGPIAGVALPPGGQRARLGAVAGVLVQEFVPHTRAAGGGVAAPPGRCTSRRDRVAGGGHGESWGEAWGHVKEARGS